MVAEANRYFAGQEPWALRKSDPARMETVLHTTAETIRRVAILCQPYVPGSAAKLLDLLAVPADKRSFANIGDADALVAGTSAAGAAPVFPRYVEQPELVACSSTAIATSIFPTSPRSAMRWSRARSRQASGAW